MRVLLIWVFLGMAAMFYLLLRIAQRLNLDLRRKLATEVTSVVNRLSCLLALSYAVAAMAMTTPARNAVASVKADRAAFS